MENITGKEFLSSIESNTIYDNCTFYLGEQHFFKVKNSHFHNCGFYNSALFSQLENCKFIDCDFIGKFALELKNLKTLPMEIFDYGFLTHLTIASSKMELPTTIDKLQNLIELRVIFCEIKALPKEIGNLKCLRTLDLTGNKILQLPKEIGKLTQLQTLLLHGNELTKLPRQIGNLSQLKRLELIMLLGRLPVEISNLHHLEYLCGYIDERDDILLQALLPKCTVETFSGKVPPPKQVFICEQLYH